MSGQLPGLMPLAGVFAVAVAAVLLLIRPPSGRRVRRVRGTGAGLRAVRNGLRRVSGDRSGQLRREAAVLLRQFSALLQSGRGEGQAWADMRDHWRRRPAAAAGMGSVPPAEGEEHPFAVLCAQVAASEQLGRGSAAGLRRHLRQTQEGSGPAERELRRLVEQLIAVTALSEQTGAPLSRLVEQLAAGMDEASELHAAVQTAAAGPRLTQLVLALLPLGGVGLGQLMGVSPLAALAGSPLGWLCLLAGAVLLAAGWWWSSRLIRGVMRHV